MNLIDDDPFISSVQKVLTRVYGLPPFQHIQKLTSGLINETYAIDGCWILQYVNPIFGPEVNDDIASLTEILRAHHVNVPILCRTLSNQYYFEAGDNLRPGIWRLMTKLPGITRNAAQNIEQIRSLAQNLAHFHRAFEQTHYTFKHVRPGVHDFHRHMRALARALETHKTHRLYEDICEINNKIEHLSLFVSIDKVLACDTKRIIHGDPKISNFMFCENTVTGTIDLDTMAFSLPAFDVGDGIRSWCNPRREDEAPEYNRESAREALGTYIEEVKILSRDERDVLPFAAPFIALELAARFARDALCEDYFGFDPQIGHGEHSLMRAACMADLCDQMM